MSLDDVAKVTKIQPRILERLEAGKLDGLPAEVFVRGFVRSFARCVGLDEGEALQRYAACGLASSQDLAPTPRARVESMVGLASGSATAARATPRKMQAVEVIDLGGDLGGVAAPVAISIEPAGAGTAEASPAVEVAAPRTAIAAESPARSAAPSLGLSDRGTHPGDSRDLYDLREKTKRRRRRKGRAPVVEDRAAWAEGPSPEPLAQGTRAESIGSGPQRSKDHNFLTARVPPRGTPSAASPIVTARAPEPGAAAPIEASEPSASRPGSSTAPDGSSARDASSATDAFSDRTATPGSDPADSTSESSEPWAPKMPPMSSAPSAPWRRPAYQAPTALAPPVPSLVIDDADPESAERVLEARADTLAPRRSFLPPILLDREDRSARQGGLTLAVILLLIAATLTLSYLMRRPSASGDGMTRRETPASLG